MDTSRKWWMTLAVTSVSVLMLLSVGVGWLGFIVAEHLDEKDQRIHAFSQTPQTTIHAHWAQVVPSVDDQGNSACVFEPDQDITAENAPQDCPYDFLVRAVLPFEKGRCPHVTVAYASSAHAQRMNMRPNPYKWGFGEIMVCQARVGDKDGERPLSARVADEPPILLSKNWTDEGGPGTVAVIGDTGCRANKEQICTEENWRFDDVARRLAPEGKQAKPDLVIHVGDYMYMKFDSWDAWRAAFFDPATPLLNAVPWIMVRGNHERCGKFGDAPLGYYLFLDIGDPQRLDCEDEAELTATYAVDIADRRVIVSDSATAWSIWASNRNGALKKGKEVPSPGREQQQDAKVANDMKRMLRQTGHLAAGAGARQTWFATHVPVFSLGGYFENKTPAYVSDPASFTMRQAWYALGDQRPMLDAILAGHLHLFQVAQATKQGEPLQIISGAGGVNIDDDLGLPNSDKGGKKCLSRDNWVAYDQTVDMPVDKQSPPATTAMHVCSNENIGYVLINKDKQGSSKYVFTPLD